MEHPVLKQAKQALDELSEDPRARVQAEQREMALFSYNLGLNRAREDGETRGRAEGETRGKAAALLTVLSARNLALTAAQRQQIEDCRDVAVLEQWLSRAVSATSADELLAS